MSWAHCGKIPLRKINSYPFWRWGGINELSVSHRSPTFPQYTPMTSFWDHTLQSVLKCHHDPIEQGYLHSLSFFFFFCNIYFFYFSGQAIFNQRCGENSLVHSKVWPKKTKGNYTYSAKNHSRLYRVRWFTSVELLGVNHRFSNASEHQHLQEVLLGHRLRGPYQCRSSAGAWEFAFLTGSQVLPAQGMMLGETLAKCLAVQNIVPGPPAPTSSGSLLEMSTSGP